MTVSVSKGMMDFFLNGFYKNIILLETMERNDCSAAPITALLINAKRGKILRRSKDTNLSDFMMTEDSVLLHEYIIRPKARNVFHFAFFHSYTGPSDLVTLKVAAGH